MEGGHRGLSYGNVQELAWGVLSNNMKTSGHPVSGHRDFAFSKGIKC
jgi:hypothetical protein